MITPKLGIVLLITAGILIPASAVTAEKPDAPRTNRFLGDRWSVRLFGNQINVELRLTSLNLSPSVVFEEAE